MYTQKRKQALNHAVDLGILAANPIARVWMLRVDNRRTKFLSMGDFTRFLRDASRVDGHDLFLKIGLTGLRPSNVRLLTVAEVDGDGTRIPPEKMKRGRWGEVPLSTLHWPSWRRVRPSRCSSQRGAARPSQEHRQRVS